MFSCHEQISTAMGETNLLQWAWKNEYKDEPKYNEIDKYQHITNDMFVDSFRSIRVECPRIEISARKNSHRRWGHDDGGFVPLNPARSRQNDNRNLGWRNLARREGGGKEIQTKTQSIFFF